MASDDLDKIERLHALRQQGLLTDEEFAAEKRKLLAGSGTATAPEVPQVPMAAPSEATSSNEAYFDESYSRHPNRRVLWTALGVAAVMIVAVLAYLLTASQGGQTAPSEQMTASDVPTIADVPAAAATSMLAQVIESDFKGQDEIPHCTLSNAEGVPIFRSAIMLDGSRAGIIKRDGKVEVLTLAGAPNRFSGENGNISAVVEYDKGAVRSVGEDEIKFDGRLTVTGNGTSESQPIYATCYGSHFDEGWAGSAAKPEQSDGRSSGNSSIEPSIIGVPSMAFSKNFPNGTLFSQRGTWAKDRQSCSKAPASELIIISENRISAFNENGEIIQGKQHDGYVEYTTKFNLDGQTWYRDFLLRGNSPERFTLSTIAFDNAMGTGRRVPMADTAYVRCSRRDF